MAKKTEKTKSGAGNGSMLSKSVNRCFPLFVLPTLAAFCIGFIYPFLKGLFLSFCNFTTTRDFTWVGVQNYIKAFQDPSFTRAFWFTSAFAAISIIVINVFAFTIAYILTQNIRGSNIFRTVFFMPNLIGGIVLGYTWSLIIDGILRRYGMQLATSGGAGFWGLVVLVAWQQIGYMMIIYIAGLQAVPGDMLEAAHIDGATPWQTLWKVTIPNVMPSITICTFLTLTNSYKMFDQNLALTGGAPIITQADGSQLKMTEMLALNIKSTFGISNKWHGVAQAKAVVFFVLVAVLALGQLYFTRNKEVQQ